MMITCTIAEVKNERLNAGDSGTGELSAEPLQGSVIKCGRDEAGGRALDDPPVSGIYNRVILD